MRYVAILGTSNPISASTKDGHICSQILYLVRSSRNTLHRRSSYTMLMPNVPSKLLFDEVIIPLLVFWSNSRRAVGETGIRTTEPSAGQATLIAATPHFDAQCSIHLFTEPIRSNYLQLVLALI